MTLTINLLPSAERILHQHASEMPQKDDLCGAFWATMALRAAGVEVDQDAAALEAGTVLSVSPREDDRPAGAASRRDYRLTVPQTEDSQLAGTSAAGVARAIEHISAGAMKVIPVSGPWEPSTIQTVLHVASSAGETSTVVANVGTRFLWSSHTPYHVLLRQLVHGDVDPTPPPDWNVGHFVGLIGVVRGPADVAVVVADTYPQLGHGGIHLQPISAVADVCERSGMTPGGRLLTVPSAMHDRATETLMEAGVNIGLWDNGGPDEPAAA